MCGLPKLSLVTAYRGKWICPANHRAPRKHTDRQETGEAELRKTYHFRTDRKTVQGELVKGLEGVVVIAVCIIMKSLGEGGSCFPSRL